MASGVPSISSWYSACTAARRAAERDLERSFIAVLYKPFGLSLSKPLSSFMKKVGFFDKLQANGRYPNLKATEAAWAGSPSACASATAAGPIARTAAASRLRKLVRFMKSSTESPEEKRARRPVGSTWLGPAT